MRFAAISYKPTVTELESRLQLGSLLVAGAEKALLAGALAPLELLASALAPLKLPGDDPVQRVHMVHEPESGVPAPAVLSLPVDNNAVSQPRPSATGAPLVKPVDADPMGAVLRLEAVTLPLRGAMARETATTQGQFPYTITDLGNLGDHPDTFGTAINAAGQVAGYAGPTGNGLAFLWDPDAGMRQLSTTSSQANGLNNLGQVVGEQGNRATIWNPDGSTQDLGTLGGFRSAGNGINDNGFVAGFSFLPNRNVHAFFYNGKGLVDLGSLIGDQGSSGATGINADGAIVGSSDAPGFGTPSHGFLWNGSMGDLQPLMNDVGSAANGVSDSARVVGSSAKPGCCQFHAVAWSGSTPTNLGTDDIPNARARAINPSGDTIVGDAIYFAGGEFHAFVSHGGTLLQDLNNLISPDSGVVLQIATAVNDAGQIVVNGIPMGSSLLHAYLLTPQLP